MKDSRIGESLWSSWQGEGYRPQGSPDYVYFTNEHLDINQEVVSRALASAIQRDGVVDSLGQAFRLVESCSFRCGYAGEVDGSLDFSECDEAGVTEYEDLVDEVFPVTWVEINV